MNAESRIPYRDTERLTKREQIAAMAMQAILTSYDEPVQWLDESAVADRAFRMADEMLAKSAKG